MPINYVQRLDEIQDLPTVPHTLQQVLHSLDKISASATTLESIIREDPVLTAKILRMANSAFYGFTGTVSSIARSVVILGFNEVRNLVIGLSLTGTFTGELGFEEFDARALWMHSVGVGVTAKMLASQIYGLDPDELFTAGLIHDIGRFLMCLYFPDELRDILRLRREERLSLSEAEERYGLSHGEIGAYLAKRWELSDLLVNTVRYHHHPQSAGTDTLPASAIFLADELCQKLKIGWSLDMEDAKVLVPKSLGLDQDVVKTIAFKMKEEKEKLEQTWLGAISD